VDESFFALGNTVDGVRRKHPKGLGEMSADDPRSVKSEGFTFSHGFCFVFSRIGSHKR